MMLFFSVTTAHMLSESMHSMRTPAIAAPKRHEQCRITPAISTAQDQCSSTSRQTAEKWGSGKFLLTALVIFRMNFISSSRGIEL
jgi:hypothetical protein